MILLVATLPWALRQIIIRSLRGFGEAWASTVSFVVCARHLIRAFDPFGVGVTLLVANRASMVYLIDYLRRRFGLGPSDRWGLDDRTVRDTVRLSSERGRALVQRMRSHGAGDVEGT